MIALYTLKGNGSGLTERQKLHQKNLFSLFITNNKVSLNYSTDNMIHTIPLLLVIIGLFFIIQSTTLKLGKAVKEESELTVWYSDHRKSGCDAGQTENEE